MRYSFTACLPFLPFLFPLFIPFCSDLHIEFQVAQFQFPLGERHVDLFLLEVIL